MTVVFGLTACHDVVSHALLIDGKPVAEADGKEFRGSKRCTAPGELPPV